jgi:hypothetical protein
MYHLQIDRFQALFQSSSIMTFKCISKLNWSWPPSASWNLFDYSFLVYLPTPTIMASKFAWSRPYKCISKPAWFLPPIVSLNSLHHGHWVCVQTRTPNGASVSNCSGPSFRVWVRVGTDLEPDWRSRWLTNPNCQFRYGSIDISQPVWTRRVLCGLYSGSICKYIYHTCLWYLIMVFN